MINMGGYFWEEDTEQGQEKGEMLIFKTVYASIRVNF